MQPELKFLGIDGFSILRTLYEADSNPNLEEKADEALKKAFAAFERILDFHQPTHVLPAFDFNGKNWRHQLYSDYKKNRVPPMPLLDRVPDFFAHLRSIGLHPIEVEGYEAEDLLASAFRRWNCGNQGKPKGVAVIVTHDKDLLPLIAEGALIWHPFARDGETSPRGQWRGKHYVEQRWHGITPEKFADYLALMGDNADSTPKIPGIAEKRAAKLIHTYGDLESVLANTHEITGIVGKNLEQYADVARLARKLVELSSDAPLGVTWNLLAYKKHYNPVTKQRVIDLPYDPAVYVPSTIEQASHLRVMAA